MARPRLALTDDHLRQIEVLAGYGLTEAAIAHVVGVSHDTLTRRKRDAERVAAAIARGKAKAEGLVGEALFKRARSGDVAAIRWWETTRAGRAERRELTGAAGGPIETKETGASFDDLTEAELLALAERLAGARVGSPTPEPTP